MCDALLESIDETITGLLSREVVKSLYLNLKTVHSIPRDEVPYRLDILISTLERIFGLRGSKTICKAIAKKSYAKLDLTFLDIPNRTLLDHVQEAKIKLRESGDQL